MDLPRSSGVLLHLSSLPGATLGKEAFRFVDWLAAAGQAWWQVLPVGPPDEFRSPYSASSAFAAWPGFLADRKARVGADEIEDFVSRHPYWIGTWANLSGEGAIADQVRFEREWRQLRAYAADRGVRIIGDLPIYVAAGGADQRAWPELFSRDEVSGCPPDAFTPDGQLWGMPLYDWSAMRASGYRWWTERFRRTFELFDLARIDHFRGFVAYWAIPKRHKTARRGRWRRGPGIELFRSVARELGPLPVLVEDLGVNTAAVDRLRDALEFPGTVVLHWAFGGKADNPHAFENHRASQVVYTSTHDTDTTTGWFAALSAKERAATGLDAKEPHWALIRRAMRSRANLVITAAQDVLGLGSAARMNTPGTTGGNWRWRLAAGELTADLASRLRDAAALGGRLPS